MNTETPQLTVSLPAHLAGPSHQGWLEAFEKLDATLHDVQAAAVDVEV